MRRVLAAHSTRLGSTRTISSQGVSSTLPDLALDDSGAGLAVWQERHGHQSRVVAATIAPNGRIATPRRLSPAGSDAILPHVLVNPGGATLVHWAAPKGETRVISHPAGAPFGPVSVLAGDRDPRESFTLDDAGETLATWDTGAAFWRADAPPSPTAFAAGTNNAMTALTPSGRALAVAGSLLGSTAIDPPIKAAVREPGQRFGSLQDIGSGYPVLLATNASGAALLLVSSRDSRPLLALVAH